MLWKTRTQSGEKLFTRKADLGLELGVHLFAYRPEQAAHPPEGKRGIKKNVFFVDELLEQPVILFDCSHIRVILHCNTANIFLHFQYAKGGIQGGTSKKIIFF